MMSFGHPGEVSRPFLIIFTDLDGTLLDHDTYSYRSALPALRKIRKEGLPLILCTSKTITETESYRRRLRNTDPFIVENGAAVFIPAGYFPSPIPRSSRRGGYEVISLGFSPEEARKALNNIGRKSGLSLTGLSEMSAARVRRLTGLSRVQASRARDRQYTEPFIVEGEKPGDRRILQEEARAEGVTLTRGGRFWHLSGGGDKGEAAMILTGLYRGMVGKVLTVGLGDSLNDFPLLDAVDIPRLVRKPGGDYQRGVPGKRVRITEGIGPAGWNQAVLEAIRETD